MDPFSVPPITRAYISGAILITALCSLEIVSPFSLYINLHLVIFKWQLWRLFTNFFFFGPLSIDFLFHMFFLARYCRLLEEGSFRGRSCDFALMLLFGGITMCVASAFISVPPFLGSSLAFMMVYVWARRNEDARDLVSEGMVVSVAVEGRNDKGKLQLKKISDFTDSDTD